MTFSAITTLPTQHAVTQKMCAVSCRLLSIMFAISLMAPTAQADEIDPIGSLIHTSIESQPTLSTWSSITSDPIGDLIKQAKIDRAHRDAAIRVDANTNSLGSQLAQAALNYIGVRYRFGGTSPQGFDCSGLIYYTADKYMGIKLPRVSSSMASVGESVQRTHLQPGDLVFFNTRGFRNSHVGIYLGNNEFLHAPRSGKNVRIEKMSNYWNKRYNGARRLTASTVTKG